MTAVTPYRQELRQRILDVATHEFVTRGIKTVTMNELALKLGISKRTLYEVYPNKEELLFAVACERDSFYDEHLMAFSADPRHNVMDILLEFYRLHAEMSVNVSPKFITELHKYESVMKEMRRRREQQEWRSVEFFKRGIKEGFFRPDVDYRLVQKLGTSTMNFLMEQRLYEEHSMQHVFRNIVFLFVRGICTLKGIAIVDDFLKKENDV